jgi:hypothetical protein
MSGRGKKKAKKVNNPVRYSKPDYGVIAQSKKHMVILPDEISIKQVNSVLRNIIGVKLKRTPVVRATTPIKTKKLLPPPPLPLYITDPAQGPIRKLLINGGAAAQGIPAAGVPAPTTVGDIYNYISQALPVGVARRDQLWNASLSLFTTVNDGMKTRGGDLTHDIGTRMRVPIALGDGTSPSMQEFITSFAPAAEQATIRTTIAQYISNPDSIKRDFRAFRMGNYPPQIFNRVRGELQNLTDYLTHNGVQYMYLDAQFGNLLNEGFGRGLTYLSNIASDTDGGSKLSHHNVANAGIAYTYDTTPFIFNYLYPNVTHSLSKHGTNNAVTISYGAQAETISCVSGISVNAVCQEAGIGAPRGSGESGNPIVIEGAQTISNHHIVMLKTMTDWSELIFTKLLAMMGIGVVLITNDEFCLGLAATLGLPYVIRTPYAGCTYVELYEFDPNFKGLEPAEKVTICNKLILTDPYKSILNSELRELDDVLTETYDCMGYLRFPPRLISKLQAQFGIIRANYIALCNTIDSYYNAGNQNNLSNVTVATVDATIAALGLPINDYRSLLTGSFTVVDYIRDKLKNEIGSVLTSYIAFGTRFQTLMSRDLPNEGADVFNDLFSLLLNFFGTDYAAIRDVLQNILTTDDNIARIREGDMRHWRVVLGKVLGTAASRYILDPQTNLYQALGNTPIEIKADSYWDNQGYKMKNIFFFINRKYTTVPSMFLNAIGYIKRNPFPHSTETIFPGIAIPIIPVNQGGGALEDDATEELMNRIMYELNKYTWPEYRDYLYKPSCSNTVEGKLAELAQIQDTENTVDAHVLAESIVNILDSLLIDAYETKVGPEYHAQIFVLEDMLRRIETGEYTYSDFALYVYVTIFFNDAAMFVTDVLSPAGLRTLLSTINNIGNLFEIEEEDGEEAAGQNASNLTSMSNENLERLSNKGKAPNSTRVNQNTGRRARRILLEREGGGHVVPEKPSKLGQLGYYGRVATLANLPAGPTQLNGQQYIMATPERTQGGGARNTRSRKHLRRTRKRGAAAARRKRTIRRRK